jgi:hypothetical protein
LPESSSRLAAGGVANWDITAAMMFSQTREKIDLRWGVPFTQVAFK